VSHCEAIRLLRVFSVETRGACASELIPRVLVIARAGVAIWAERVPALVVLEAMGEPKPSG
jgi:hypothetical protein